MTANKTKGHLLLIVIIGLIVSFSSQAMSVRMNEINPKLIEGWRVLYTDSKYRDLSLHFESSKYQIDWTSILDDAGLRYGLAYLVDMDKQELLITQANTGLLKAGVHFVQPHIIEQSNRYRWPALYQAGLTELSQYDFDQKVAENERFLEQQRLTQAEINRRVKTTRDNLQASYDRKSEKLTTDYAAKQKRLSDTYSKKEKNLSQQRQIIANIKRSNDLKTKSLNNLESKLANQKMLQATQQKVISAKEKAINEKEKTLNQQIIAQEIITKNLRDKYYPSDSRYIPKGNAEANIREFLKNNWKYELKWADSAVQDIVYNELVFINDLHFKQFDLKKDISQIVCTLTRDNDEISFYADIDAGSRVVYLQLHATTDDIRKRIISDCFK